MDASLATLSPDSSQEVHADESRPPPPSPPQTTTEVGDREIQYAEQEDHPGSPAPEPANKRQSASVAVVQPHPESEAAAPASETLAPARVISSPSALIIVVGHLRRFENTLGAHRKLVQAATKALGAAPAVCIATYPQRDHHDRTWWHGGDQTHDTSLHVDPAAVAAGYNVPLSQVQMLEPSSVQNPTKYMVSAICHTHPDHAWASTIKTLFLLLIASARPPARRISFCSRPKSLSMCMWGRSRPLHTVTPPALRRLRLLSLM